MMLIFKNFSCHCACCSYNIKEYYSSCNSFSYNFDENVYLLCGSIDCGAWAFVNSISSHCKKKSFGNNTVVIFNEEILSQRRAQNICCYLNEKPQYRVLKISLKKAVNNAIKKYKYEGSYQELLNLFEIPEHFHNKPVSELGIYYPCYLAMVGLIKGYKIFATTWQGRFGFDSHIIEKIAKAITIKKLMLFIPTDANNIYNFQNIKINMVDLFDDLRIRDKYR